MEQASSYQSEIAYRLDGSNASEKSFLLIGRIAGGARLRIWTLELEGATSRLLSEQTLSSEHNERAIGGNRSKAAEKTYLLLGRMAAAAKLSMVEFQPVNTRAPHKSETFDHRTNAKQANKRIARLSVYPVKREAWDEGIDTFSI
jgi:hypothetical protein